MALSLRNPETQAKVSGVLVAAALVVLLAALGLAFSRFDWTLRSFVYSTTGARMPAVYGGAFLSLILAGGAFWFSYASAGERRNSYSRLSWICFGISALTIVLTLVFMAAYKFMGWQIKIGG